MDVDLLEGRIYPHSPFGISWSIIRSRTGGREIFLSVWGSGSDFPSNTTYKSPFCTPSEPEFQTSFVTCLHFPGQKRPKRPKSIHETPFSWIFYHKNTPLKGRNPRNDWHGEHEYIKGEKRKQEGCSLPLKGYYLYVPYTFFSYIPINPRVEKMYL